MDVATPVAVTLDVRANTLTIRWADGLVSRYGGAYLRWICPCAACTGHVPGEVPPVEFERVKDVRVTHRLTDSPACLVADEHDLGGNLARLLKAAGQKVPDSQPILEINPDHPVVQRLKYEEKRFDDWSAVLFDQALLAEGGQLEDPASFVRRVNALMLEMGGK